MVRPFAAVGALAGLAAAPRLAGLTIRGWGSAVTAVVFLVWESGVLIFVSGFFNRCGGVTQRWGQAGAADGGVEEAVAGFKDGPGGFAHAVFEHGEAVGW